MLTVPQGEAEPRFEQRIEWRRQFWHERSVGVDQDPQEERLVELPLDVVRRSSVGESAVHGEIECRLETLGDLVELVVACIQLARYLKERAGDALLLALQDFERDRVLVVRLHELFPLPLQLLPLSPQIGKLGVRIFLCLLQLLHEERLDLHSEAWIESDSLVVILDLSFDLVDENGLLATVVSLAVPTPTHEVRVLLAGAGPGDLHQKSGAARATEDSPFQEVGVLAGSLPVEMSGQYVLDGLEGALVD